MQEYKDFQPTCFDSRGAFLDDRQDWLIVPVGRTRDSGPLANSNFETAQEILEKIDPDGEDHEAHSFNHWGPGWFEILICRPGTKCAEEGERIEDALENYPVLDDEDFSEREYEEARESWSNWACQDFKQELIRQFDLTHGAPVVDDADADVLWEFWMRHSNVGYESGDDGAHFDFRRLSRQIDRSALRRFLRKLHRAERSAV